MVVVMYSGVALVAGKFTVDHVLEITGHVRGTAA
jgi:hypothetical protein